MQQVATVRQAEVAVEHGADIVVAQGGEAGGYGGSVATLALVPHIVDAVSPVWKQAMIASVSEAWVQLDFFNTIRPNPGALGYGTRMRALRTEFTDRR